MDGWRKDDKFVAYYDPKEIREVAFASKFTLHISRDGIMYQSFDKEKAIKLEFKNTKLNRKLYPNYQEFKGYLISQEDFRRIDEQEK